MLFFCNEIFCFLFFFVCFFFFFFFIYCFFVFVVSIQSIGFTYIPIHGLLSALKIMEIHVFVLN